MSNGTVITLGILSSIILVTSCIALNAQSYYNNLSYAHNSEFLNKEKIFLRDRVAHNVYRNLDRRQKVEQW